MNEIVDPPVEEPVVDPTPPEFDPNQPDGPDEVPEPPGEEFPDDGEEGELYDGGDIPTS